MPWTSSLLLECCAESLREELRGFTVRIQESHQDLPAEIPNAILARSMPISPVVARDSRRGKRPVAEVRTVWNSRESGRSIRAKWALADKERPTRKRR